VIRRVAVVAERIAVHREPPETAEHEGGHAPERELRYHVPTPPQHRRGLVVDRSLTDSTLELGAQEAQGVVADAKAELGDERPVLLVDLVLEQDIVILGREQGAYEDTELEQPRLGAVARHVVPVGGRRGGEPVGQRERRGSVRVVLCERGVRGEDGDETGEVGDSVRVHGSSLWAMV
jgi:hypothetical protein